MSKGSRAARAACAVVPVAAALAHIGPAATWLHGPRRLLLPALAGQGRPDHVALTFDDGPDPVSTPLFLDVLDGLGVRATFFVLGENVVRHPAQARELARRGHELAVHGWSHDPPWLPSPARDARELRRAVQVVRETTGRTPAGTARPTASSPPAAGPLPGASACVRCCGRRGARTGGGTPRPPRSAPRSRPTCAGAAPSSSTTPTTPPPPAAGGRRSPPCPASWATAARRDWRSGRCWITGSPGRPVSGRPSRGFRRRRVRFRPGHRRPDSRDGMRNGQPPS